MKLKAWGPEQTREHLRTVARKCAADRRVQQGIRTLESLRDYLVYGRELSAEEEEFFRAEYERATDAGSGVTGIAV